VIARNVRCGSKADIGLAPFDVRLPPKADIRNFSDYGPDRLRSDRPAQEAEGADDNLNKQSDEHGRTAEWRPYCLAESQLQALFI
jgi:hypothetical protein